MENIPQSPKRFPLQEDVFAGERIHATRDAILETKKEFPEIISGALLGSLARGKSKKETSDIDCMVFVNPTHSNSLDIKYKDPLYPFWIDIESSNSDSGVRFVHTNYFFDSQDYAAYKEVLHSHLLKKVSDLNEEKIFHFAPIAISKEYIKVVIDGNNLMLNDQKGFKDQIISWLPKEKEFASNDSISYAIDIPETLYGIFYLELGKGLEEYRKYLIEYLDGLGSSGETIWRRISYNLERREQEKWGVGPNEVYYPRTLAEARKTYLNRYEYGINKNN